MARRATGGLREAFSAQATHLPGVMAVDACSKHRFPRHAHEEFGIGVITAGAQTSWSGRGQVQAQAGELITVNPGEVHDGAPVSASRAWSMLYFAPEVIAQAVEDLGAERGVALELQAPVVRTRPIVRLFGALRAAATASWSTPDAAQSQLLPLLAALLLPAQRMPACDAPGLRRMQEMLEDAPAAAHSLEQMARVCGLSRYQTLRGFQRLTGLTPHAYLNRCRLERARAAIRAGQRLVDVAAAVGYSDQSHFHRVFVRQFGLTPGGYARACIGSRGSVQDRPRRC
ncbi:helix-turn-helix transcriptional regulator [Pseudoxanthomonas composti]|uniref:AraC family transcriptional regulator n=1 Tax=Pseudoxanthomonas composti TaxID=2137479 RepID=A0A4Q1JU44_9GAMM|nr:AraC family transcriptional regulator [Pseudoxanthomonas composti]RXR05202.1 AraC family transcriptional regulator [Pseudoxanthomonas composti]